MRTGLALMLGVAPAAVILGFVLHGEMDALAAGKVGGKSLGTAGTSLAPAMDVAAADDAAIPDAHPNRYSLGRSSPAEAMAVEVAPVSGALPAQSLTAKTVAAQPMAAPQAAPYQADAAQAALAQAALAQAALAQAALAQAALAPAAPAQTIGEATVRQLMATLHPGEKQIASAGDMRDDASAPAIAAKKHPVSKHATKKHAVKKHAKHGRKSHAKTGTTSGTSARMNAHRSMVAPMGDAPAQAPYVRHDYQAATPVERKEGLEYAIPYTRPDPAPATPVWRNRARSGPHAIKP